MNGHMRRRRGATPPVDADTTHEWEADAANRVAAGLLFWCWYLPGEILRSVVRRLRPLLAPLARGRALLRYPLYTAPVRAAAARVPTRR